jgi:hypothetical protein
MPQNITFNGSGYSVPLKGERGWATSLSQYLVDIASGCLQKTGGAFDLSGEIDFGLNFGIKAKQFSTLGTVAGSGIVRLANADSIAWRNAGNTADVVLTVDLLDRLLVNGVPVLSLPALAFDRAVISNASGLLDVSPVTTTELTYVSGVTSGIQSQFTATTAAVATKQNITSTLTALDTMPSTLGLIAQTSADVFDARSIVAGSSKVSVVDGSGSTGDPTIDVVEANINVGSTTGNIPFARVTGIVPTSQGGTGLNSTATFPAAGVVVTQNSTDTLTNKTLTDPVVNTIVATEQGTTPASPSSGFGKLYKKTDGKFYTLDSTGLETEIGKGGSSGRNYLQDYFDATKTVSCSTLVSPSANLVSLTACYADSSSGSAAITVSAVSPLRQASSYLTAFSGASLAGNTFVQFQAFAVDSIDAGKPININCDIFTSVADFDVVIARYTSAGVFVELMPVYGNLASTASATPSSLLKIGLASESLYFIPSSTITDTYALRFRRLTGTSQLKVDSISMGPRTLNTSAAITDWQTYLPTFIGLGTVTMSNIRYRQSGPNIQIEGRFTTGTPTATAATFTLPGSLLSNLSLSGCYGHWIRDTVTVNQHKKGSILLSASSNLVFFGLTDYSTTTNPFLGQNGTTLFAANQIVHVNLEVPIQSFSSNTFSASNALTEYAWNTDVTNTDTITSSFQTGSGDGGSVFGAYATTTRVKRVRFQQPISPLDTLFLRVTNVVTGRFLELAAGPFMSLSATTGMMWDYVVGSATDIDVKFGSVGYAANLASGGAAAWSTIANNTQYKWQMVKKSPGGDALLPIGARNIVGDTTGTPVPAGFVGEFIKVSPVAAATTASVPETRTQFTIGVGNWDLQATAIFRATSAVTGTRCYLVISTTLNSMTPIATEAYADITTQPVFNVADTVLHTAVVSVNVTTPTTFYLNTLNDRSAGTVDVIPVLQSRRRS